MTDKLTPFQKVQEFHRTYGVETRDTPGFPSEQVELFRLDLLTEEFAEYVLALRRGDLVEIADALADIKYILLGTSDAYGIDMDAGFSEVHRSNMSKLGEDGEVIRREDGKVLKGPNYTRPDLATVCAIPVEWRGTELVGVSEILSKHEL